MKHYAGVDISVKETAACIVDETGKICRQVKVVSHPDDLTAVLKDPALRIERIGSRPDRCPSGRSKAWPGPVCRQSASRPDTPRHSSRRGRTRAQ